MPFKANQDRRHHIPKQRHQVTNWPEYDAALRQRGSLTVWFTEAAIASLGCRASHQPRWAAALLRSGDHDGTHLAGRVPPRVAPNRGSDRVDRSPAWSCSRRARPLDLEPPSRDIAGGPAAIEQRARPSDSSTAPAFDCAVPANGWSRSMARGRVGPGGSCTSALTPTPARSSPPS